MRTYEKRELIFLYHKKGRLHKEIFLFYADVV